MSSAKQAKAAHKARLNRKSRAILFGQTTRRPQFDKVTRLKGTQTRIGQVGSEFFLLDAYFRVIGIAKTYEQCKSLYHGPRTVWDRYFTLENITRQNKNRCSAAKSKEIFDGLKDNKGRQTLKYGDKFELRGTKYKVTEVRSLY